MQAEPTAPHARIVALARRWRALRLAAWGGAALLLASAAWLITRGVTVPCLAAVACLVVAWYTDRRRPINAHTVARHLNRVAPTLEESAELLLDSVRSGSALERMQRRRAAAALSDIETIPGMRTPVTRLAVLASGGFLLLAALLVTISSRAPARATALAAVDSAAAPQHPRLNGIRLQWSPPRYTGRGSRSGPPANLAVEEGSTVEWQVDATGAALVRIVDMLGDTLATEPGDNGWHVTTVVAKARVWRAEVVGSSGELVRSEAYLLAVTPDRPPVIAILAPPGRTEMEWAEAHRVVVRAVVSDDYGIGSTALLATVAAGRGEGVRFRERRLPLERESATSTGEVVMSALVDLDALEVAPGDEVYLAVEAADRRMPVPQVARSETVFLTLRDTLDPVSSDFGGIAIDIEPEFFRSQRQIILDTEALLADVRRGRVREPLERAMEIGYDQYLLRVRYGEIAGQEDEVRGADPSAAITEADLMHQHDTEDNATLLAASVKATLQAALAAMWEAEKQLRTGHPDAALPHEYRALVALEQIRQAQRAYVKRIGFEPPAIDVSRTRLTKDAKDVASLEQRHTPGPVTAVEGLRAALDVIDATADPGRAAALEAAARALAAQALRGVEGTHLETLGALRRLLDGDRSAGVREQVRAGLLAALPVPPTPIVPSRPR